MSIDSRKVEEGEGQVRVESIDILVCTYITILTKRPQNMIIWMSVGIWVSYASLLHEIIQGPRFPCSHCYIPYDIVLICMVETGSPSFAWTSPHEIEREEIREQQFPFQKVIHKLPLSFVFTFNWWTLRHMATWNSKDWKRGSLAGGHGTLGISFSAIVGKMVRALGSSREASLDTML